MFTVIFLTTVNNVLTVFAYGTFATKSAAEAWIAGQSQSGQYLIASTWSGVVPPGGTALAPAAVPVGSWAVALVFVDPNGLYVCYLYGPFATQQLAQTYQAAQFPPGGYSVVQVLAVPA